jgi:hypothetical protein
LPISRAIVVQNLTAATPKTPFPDYQQKEVRLKIPGQDRVFLPAPGHGSARVNIGYLVIGLSGYRGGKE